MDPVVVTLLFLLFAIVMFVWERIPLAVTSMIVCIGLVLTGVLSTKDAFAGFTNSNVILFVAMFIVGGALFETGMANKIGGVVTRFAKTERQLIVTIMIVVGRRLVPWILAKTASTGSRELFTLSVLALAMGVAYGAVAIFDVSFALGAFFAGMVLNESELSHRAAHDTLPLRDAFAVLFFVSVGMLFDPMILVEQPLAVLGCLAIIVFGKSVAAFLLVKMFGHSKRTALTVSVSLAQIGEFAFILAGLGISLNMLSPEGRNLVLAGAILSIMINPLLFTLLERYLAKTETIEDQSLQEVTEEEEKQIPVDLCNHVLLVGYGRVGSLIGAKLHDAGVPLVVHAHALKRCVSKVFMPC